MRVAPQNGIELFLFTSCLIPLIIQLCEERKIIKLLTYANYTNPLTINRKGFNSAVSGPKARFIELCVWQGFGIEPGALYMHM